MKSILIVDDQAELRQLIELSLGDKDYRIRQATNGQEALDAAQEEIPDLIVLDLMMPGSPDGFGVCWEIKSDLRFSRTRIIVLSAWSVKNGHRVCESFGADAFVAKPFSPSQLAARVEDILSERPDESYLIRKRVLIVDDQPELRKLIGLTLGHKDYEIIEAGTGPEALDALHRQAPHAVILDLLMPGDMSGHDVCHAIKMDERLATVPVLILTSSGNNEDRSEADRRGADDFMLKPFSPLDLISRVDRLVSTSDRGGSL